MPLRGIKVLEFAGLAPGPFCGKILSDFGATVTRIDRSYTNPIECMKHGKRTVAMNIKNKKSQQVIQEMCKHYDVLVEPFRPGVMEKCNLGPDILMENNSKLIYARLTGFGQTGPLSARAGHDINYVATSGVLSLLGRKEDNPTPPINLLADFAGGGLLCAFGICIALLERHKSGKGQIVDSSMVEGAAYVASWLTMSQHLPIWGRPRGENFLDTGSFFYDTYKTKDGKFMSVGALEPQFFDKFIEGLGLNDVSQHTYLEVARKKVQEAFLKKTQTEWAKIFNKIDACVFPIVDWQDAPEQEHNKFRKSFKLVDDQIIPVPAPRLSRTPGQISNRIADSHEIILEIFKDIGKTEDDVKKMYAEGTISNPNVGKL